MKSKLFEIPNFVDERGFLGILDSKLINFEIKRIYFLTNVPNGQNRGDHWHKKLKQVFVAVSGSFEISVENEYENKVYKLHKPTQALFIPEMSWRVLENFTEGTTCLVIASEEYDVNDYFTKEEWAKNQSKHNFNKK
jgi:dTDP-4-dehydrorhamnose 3,5-epimerase-like enzyme